MRSPVRFGLLLCLAAATTSAASLTSLPFAFHVSGGRPGPWPAILSSIGLLPGAENSAGLHVVREAPASEASVWLSRVEQGAFLVLEGQSELGAALGFRPTGQRVAVRSLVDERRPKLHVVWETAAELPVFEVPAGSRVFARERWQEAPLLAGYRHGLGAVLWLAASPGEQGYERFPYLLQALCDLGFQPPFRSARLWAFFDSSYRSRVDLDYFAERWRKAGISALHVAAWHFHEPAPERDAWLTRLIQACHRQAILVYAWIELPHVSEQFWNTYPGWREKTALLQDAHLDWRKLMNLANRDCFRQAAADIHQIIDRFDWDGVNLAELYFESLEGHANAARFTPLNEDVRRAFAQSHGFDPLDLFNQDSPRHFSSNPAGLRHFLDFRAGLARQIQIEWVEQLEAARRRKPHLDLVLTHVDDRFDTRMRDLIGADAASLLPILERHDITFLIEDPATIWHLGPQRYPQIASRYAPLTRRTAKLGIDINIVERYQDVYPTKQQTGIELFQLVHLAAGAFPRVALYFENSILAPDLPLLPSAAAIVDRIESAGSRLMVSSRQGVGVPWKGGAFVGGSPWPYADDTTLWLPPGLHTIESAPHLPSVRLLDFNGGLTSALSLPDGVELTYASSSRALAVFDKRPVRMEVDGVEVAPQVLDNGAAYVAYLPRGQHLVTVRTQ